MPRPEDLARYRANLRAELDGAALYRAIAEAEQDPARRAVLMELSLAETRHAALWRKKLRRGRAGAALCPQPAYTAAWSLGPTFRTALRYAESGRRGICGP